MGKPEPLLRETFRVCGKPYSIFLFHHQLAWCPQKKGGEDMSEWINVKLKDVLSAEIIHRSDHVQMKTNCCVPNRLKKKSVSYPFQLLVITFAQAKKDSEKWRDISLELDHDDHTVLSKWFQAIQNSLAEFKGRPKNLLFFVNPFGGRKQAVSIYETEVKPLLKLCKVKSTVVQTRRRNHASEVLTAMSDEELLGFDAVVAVGGDGTVCEVVTGLLTRKLSKVEPIHESDLKPSSIPMGVIAAGSTNASAYTLHGTDDPRTGIIHIVLGESLPLDVASVHNPSGVVRFIVGQMSYGYFADTMVHSEGLRWMGPKRYDYSGFRKLLSHATYEGSIEILQATDENRKIPSQCTGGKGCEDCTALIKPTTSQWKRLEGRFIGISGANISLRCPLCPLGMAPFAHLSDGCMELILIRKTSRLSHLRYLLRTAGDSRRAFALPFVERYRVKEFSFTPIESCNNNMKSSVTTDEISQTPQSCKCDQKQPNKLHSVWNCDGELLYQPSVRVTVHSNLIQILARNDKEATSRRLQSSDQDDHSCLTASSTLPTTRSPSIATEELGASAANLNLNESYSTLHGLRF